MATFKMHEIHERVTPLASELIKVVLGLPPEQQRELLAELNARKGSARRRFARQPYAHAVQFTAGGKLFTGSIRDISNGGIFVETLKSDLPLLRKGQEVTMSFASPYNSKYVKCSGEIVRSGGEGVGIRFDRAL